MTGGIGFSRQGQGSFQSNRDLRSQRTTMGENPYSGKFKGNREEASKNLNEVRKWKSAQEKIEWNRLKILIWALLSLGLLTYILTIIL